jgi:hypothetical protein
MAMKHRRRAGGVGKRREVPFNSFSKFNKAEVSDIWFALDENRRPLLDASLRIVTRGEDPVGPAT